MTSVIKKECLHEIIDTRKSSGMHVEIKYDNGNRTRTIPLLTTWVMVCRDCGKVLGHKPRF